MKIGFEDLFGVDHWEEFWKIFFTSPYWIIGLRIIRGGGSDLGGKQRH